MSFLPHNYRPISKVPFIANILEKVAAKQFTAVLEENSILDKFQSVFRQLYSTGTALLRMSKQNFQKLFMSCTNCTKSLM